MNPGCLFDINRLCIHFGKMDVICEAHPALVSIYRSHSHDKTHIFNCAYLR